MPQDPRAAVNISEGTWGGHHIVGNDLFDTVKETGDHGALNAWGRDRFWHPDRREMDRITSEHPDYPFLDAIETVVIENNRIRCDRGWDIDLDDGASNYLIRNNLCLSGGIKLREGFHRVVDNNILVNSSFHPHVWFEDSQDVFTHNIVMAPYEPVNISKWGKTVDNNVFTDRNALETARTEYGTDASSVFIPLSFTNPLEGDYSVKTSSPEVLESRFTIFDMDAFGVVSSRLSSIASKPVFSIPIVGDADGKVSESQLWNGLRIKDLETPGEQSATGMDSIRGVYVIAVVDRYSKLNDYLRPNDVILGIGDIEVNSVSDLPASLPEGNGIRLKVFRNQAIQAIPVD